MSEPLGGGDNPEVVVLTAHEMLRIRRWFALLLGAVILLGIALGVSVPRALAWPGLVQENFTLRERLHEIDATMEEVDRTLLRLRVYDAHLRSLGEPRGDAGGRLPPEAFANHGLGEEAWEGELGAPMEREPRPGEVDVAVGAWFSGLRPAEAWATSIQARASAFLAMVQVAEPDLNQAVERLEDLAALEAALPRTWPAKGLLSSGYGWRRAPMARHHWRFHSGIDVADKRGAPIRAAAAGKVIFSGWSGGYGRFIEIDHGYGVTTAYAHCDRLRVDSGAVVEAGQVIATMGSTGYSTGPHLHFELRLDGNPVDPLDYLPRPEPR